MDMRDYIDLASSTFFSPSMLAKHKVVGSTPITRSIFKPLITQGLFSLCACIRICS